MRCCACKLRRGYFWTNRAGAGTRLIDGLRIRGGFRLRPQARTGAIRGYCRWFGGTQKALHRIRQRQRWMHSGQSTVRFAVAFEATAILAVVVQHREWQRLGVKGREAQHKSCNVRWTGNQDFEQFDAIRSQDCIRSVMRDANNRDIELYVMKAHAGRTRQRELSGFKWHEWG
jgi:hypothetical protein